MTGSFRIRRYVRWAIPFEAGRIVKGHLPEDCLYLNVRTLEKSADENAPCDRVAAAPEVSGPVPTAPFRSSNPHLK